MNVSDVVESMANATLSVSRRGDATFAAGRLTAAGAVVVTSMRALVVPAAGRDLDRLPEGDRERETVTVTTSGDLRNGDAFTYEGDAFEVAHVEPWRVGGFVHAVALKGG